MTKKTNRQEIDRFDRKILDLLQENARLTSREIGERVGLSATSCQRRINRMRTYGIIEREIAVVSPKAVGRSLLIVIDVVLERGDSSLINRFRKRIVKRPEVMQAYYLTGQLDFMLIVSMEDMEEYDAFTREMFFDNEDVFKFETKTVMDRTKTGFAIPTLLNCA